MSHQTFPSIKIDFYPFNSIPPLTSDHHHFSFTFSSIDRPTCKKSWANTISRLQALRVKKFKPVRTHEIRFNSQFPLSVCRSCRNQMFVGGTNTGLYKYSIPSYSPPPSNEYMHNALGANYLAKLVPRTSSVLL